jgi:hypothetical protein
MECKMNLKDNPRYQRAVSFKIIEIKNSASNGNTAGVLTDGWALPEGM